MRNQPLDKVGRANILHGVDLLKRTVRDSMHVELSYDDASIQQLVTFIESVRVDLDPQPRQQLAVAVGSFLGEAIIATQGGAWVVRGQELGIEFPDGSVAFPVTKAIKHFENGLVDNIYGLYRNIPRLRTLDSSKAGVIMPSHRKPWWRFW
jgi:hypothetical protein